MHKAAQYCIGAFGLFLGSLQGACSSDSQPAQAVEIQAQALVGGVPARCGQSYQGWGKSFELADARVYLSGIELFAQDTQTWVPLFLDDNPWQDQGVALLDFEDGQGACQSFGSPSQNRRIRGVVPQGVYSGLRFSVGIPQHLNHINPNTARGVLAETGMFWTWQGGYKFIKTDFLVNQGEQKAPLRYNLHMGSTGCRSAAALIAPTAPCDRPNVARITLQPFDPTTQALTLDLDALIAPQFSAVVSGSPSCMGASGQPAYCDEVTRNLGLDPVTGRCLGDCLAQKAFRAGPLPPPGTATSAGTTAGATW